MRYAFKRSPNPAEIYLSGLRLGSVRTMRQALDLVAATLRPGKDHMSFPWHRLRRGDVLRLRQILCDSLAVATVNKTLSAVRGVAREAQDLGLISATDYLGILHVKSISGQALPPGRRLTRDELSRLFVAASSGASPARERNLAILAILYNGGTRRNEVTTLDLEDWNGTEHSLAVHGKGGNDYRVFIEGGFADMLNSWVCLRGDGPGPLLVSVNKAGRLGGRRLTSQAIYDIIRRLGSEARVSDFSPVDFRRTSITDRYEARTDLDTLRRSVGHKNLDSTVGYLRRGSKAQKDAAEAMWTSLQTALGPPCRLTSVIE